uniref:DUF123 domain-containing protein n=1 Tax=Fervidicoccus fontis TaxID=683846 RepID=A0A7J3ZKC7_9CREN
MVQLLSYIIELYCTSATVKTRKRTFSIERGPYIYIGSCGRSCWKRIARHFRTEKKLFWHIDYATTACLPINAIVLRVEEKCLAKSLSEGLEYVRGFGCSDDREAPSHLFKASLREAIDAITARRPCQWRGKKEVIGL